MATTRETLKTNLQSIAKTAPIEEMVQAAQQFKNKADALMKSQLGKDLQSSLAGIKAATIENDYGTTTVDGTGTAFAESVPELAKEVVSSSKSALESIMGTTVSNGNSHEVATGNSPKAILKSLQASTGKTSVELGSVAAQFADPQFQADLTSAIQKGEEDTSKAAENFFSEVGKFTNKIDAAVGTDANNIMESLMSKVDGTNKNKLIKLSEGSFSMDKISELLKIMSDATPAANALATSEIIKLKPDLDRGTVEDTVAGVDTSVSGNLAPEPRSKAMGTSSLPNFEIGTSAASWEDQNTVVDTPETSREKRAEAVFNPKKETTTTSSGPISDSTRITGRVAAYKFDYVETYEELAADFYASTRDITEVVVHWSATYLNQDIGADEIHEWHTQRGFSGIGYHYVIRKDGRIQRGRPIDRTGAHAKDNGHNNFSIGLCLVGGYNCMTGTPNSEKHVSGASINSDQIDTLDEFLDAFYMVWPGGQVWGHIDVDNKGKVDPGLDMPEFVENWYTKYNLAKPKDGPITPAQARSQFTTAELVSQQSLGARFDPFA